MMKIRGFISARLNEFGFWKMSPADRFSAPVWMWAITPINPSFRIQFGKYICSDKNGDNDHIITKWMTIIQWWWVTIKWLWPCSQEIKKYLWWSKFWYMTNLCKSKKMEDILKIDDHNDKKMWQNKNVLGRGLVRFPWGDLTDNFAAILRDCCDTVTLGWVKTHNLAFSLTHSVTL